MKTEFGAVGDGQADDTAAIQRTLVSVRSKDSPQKVLYFPAGNGQVVAEHVKAVRKTPTGLNAVDGIGKATPEFIREMLIPLRTVKPQPLTDLDQSVSDVCFYRVWANGKNGVCVQAAPRGKP